MGINPEFDVQDKYQLEIVPIQLVHSPKQLANYVIEIQEWLFHYPVERFPTLLLQPYCNGLIKLIESVIESSIDKEYITSKLYIIDSLIKRKTGRQKSEDIIFEWDYNRIMDWLGQYLERIDRISWEYTANVDDISRVFISFLEDSKFNYTQAQLNRAKEGILPLWQQCRFETRYVLPNLTNY